MPPIEHPYGWLSLVPPLTAIVLAIITKRVILSLMLGILFGALVLKNWDMPAAIGHMVESHLWHKLVDSDTLHVFFFTILMGTMVGMINRAAGMRGLVNALTPMASNRKRGQLTTWFLGLFVFFDDYANTMLLGNTLKPLTDKLKIAREKLAYLVDSTAAPVAGLALISTWVAGEIGYVQSGLDSLPVEDSWNAFSIFVQSIPYRFYVLFALIFVPIVALMGRDFGPMLKAEREAMSSGQDLADIEPTENIAATMHRDPTAPEPETPARWFNAVIPIVVTVGAVIYFLYTSGSSSTDKTNLMDIFGEADSYSSLLWGALWGAGTAYVLIAIQRLISFKQLHQAAADGARLMVPALLVLWLAQAMSGMTKNQDLGEDHKPVVSAMIAQEASCEQIVQYLANQLETGNQEPAQILDAMRMYIDAKHMKYMELVEEDYKFLVERKATFAEIRRIMKAKEAKAFKDFNEEVESLLESIKDKTEFKKYVQRTVPVADGETATLESEFGFAGMITREETVSFDRWQALAGDDEEKVMEYDSEPTEYPTFEFRFLYREGKLYTGDFLSERLASLRDGDGFVANNFVPLLPTMVFVLASIVAFSTGTSWGTMGIVMPLVIPLAYSQLAAGGEEVSANNAIFLCCVGSVLAGAIFGDHCSPISDTTVLSSQASGCDHVAHVRTQLPYAMLVGLIAIVFGTLPIGYGVPAWLLIPLGIAAMVGAMWLVGSKVESDSTNDGK